MNVFIPVSFVLNQKLLREVILVSTTVNDKACTIKYWPLSLTPVAVASEPQRRERSWPHPSLEREAGKGRH